MVTYGLEERNWDNRFLYGDLTVQNQPAVAEDPGKIASRVRLLHRGEPQARPLTPLNAPAVSGRSEFATAFPRGPA